MKTGIIATISVLTIIALSLYAGYLMGYDKGVIKGESNVKGYMEFTIEQYGLTYFDSEDNIRVYLKPVILTKPELDNLKRQEYKTQKGYCSAKEQKCYYLKKGGKK